MSATTLFSMQVSTVICEHVKRSSRYLRQRCGLRYNAFTILLCMLEAARPVSAAELADYLMLSRHAVLTLLLALEDGGHIRKIASADDGRFMECAPTEAGVRSTREASEGVSRMLADTFLRSLPMAEFDLFADIDTATRFLRGHDVPGFGAKAPGTGPVEERGYLFPSGHFVEWRVLIERWKACVRKRCGLSFEQYRVLELVDQRAGMMLKEVASCLQMQKSGLAVYKADLVRRGLLLERPDPFDGRSTLVRCSSEGAEIVESLRAELDGIMRAGHEGLDEKREIILAAWYMRMYSNMRTNTESGYDDGRACTKMGAQL